MAAPPEDRRFFSLRSEGDDQKAIDRLLEQHLPWLAERVRQRLGPALRHKAESQDFVQAVALKVLQYGPRVRITDEARFRALLARIVENVIRDENAWHRARRRAMSRERPLAADSTILLDPPRGSAPRPSQAAAAHEWEEWVGLGLEFIDAEDREVIVLRQWDDRPFPEIARRLGITESGARMRYGRALARLAGCIAQLRAGGLDEMLGPAGPSRATEDVR